MTKSTMATTAAKNRQPSDAPLSGAPRAPMTVAISADGGKSWPWRNLDEGDGYCMTNNSEKLNREFSYPSIKQSPDGTLHIAYTGGVRPSMRTHLPEWVGSIMIIGNLNHLSLAGFLG